MAEPDVGNLRAVGVTPNGKARVRCPSPRCAAIFEVEPARLGRNDRCPACGIGLTARPLEIEARLRDQQRRTLGVETSSIARLPLAVLVDNVRSLWNVGSIFRTADGCAVERLVLAGITGCPPRAEIAKTALGAEKVVAWRYRADVVEALEDLCADGFVPVAIETSPRAVGLDDVVWPDRTCLVVGNEVSGVSPSVLEACSHHVCIPMRGLKDSLNVAVAFGIAAYAASRALTASTTAGWPQPHSAGGAGDSKRTRGSASSGPTGQPILRT